MMEQSRALNALAPFLALSKAATSPRAASDVVTQATSAPNAYVFAELLSTPAIQALKQNADYSKYYTLLELFAWGTWADYQANAASLPQLSEGQSQKLRLLSLLTLASTATSSSDLTYASLQAALGLSSTRELEKLVTYAIYENLITGTMDSKQQLVAISSVAPLRDLAPGSVTKMVQELDAWSTRCDSVLAELEADMAKVRADAVERKKWDAERERQIKAAEKLSEKGAGGSFGGPSLRSGGQRLGGNGAEFEQDPMDVDSDETAHFFGSKRKGYGRKR